jgi:hypothetical protein
MTDIQQLLADWHTWASKTTLSPIAGKCAMFAQSQTPKHWDSTGEIDDDLINQAAMEAIDFAVQGDNRGQGGMPEPYKTMIALYAKNLSTGKDVYLSPRLPKNHQELTAIKIQAVDILTKKLKIAGVL